MHPMRDDESSYILQLKAIMKRLIKVAIFLIALNYSVLSVAATTYATGKVSWLRHYGSGMMLVYGLTFDNGTSLTHCTGTQSGILIPSDYVEIDRLVSLLLTAKVTQSTVTVKGIDVGSSCWAPTFTNSSYVDFQ